MITEIIDKINKNNFNKYDFDKLSKDKNVNIKKISLNNQNDDKILKKEIENQIYQRIFYRFSKFLMLRKAVTSLPNVGSKPEPLSVANPLELRGTFSDLFFD